MRAGLRAAQISLQAWQSHDESQKQDCSFRRIDCGGPSIPFYTPAKCNLPEVIKGLTFLWAGSTVMLPGLSVFSYYQRILFYPLLSAPFSAGYMNVCSPSTEKKYIRPFFLSNNILVPQAWIASNFLSQNIDKGQGRQNLVEVSGGQVMKPHVDCWLVSGQISADVPGGGEVGPRPRVSLGGLPLHGPASEISQSSVVRTRGSTAATVWWPGDSGWYSTTPQCVVLCLMLRRDNVTRTSRDRVKGGTLYFIPVWWTTDTRLWRKMKGHTRFIVYYLVKWPENK